MKKYREKIKTEVNNTGAENVSYSDCPIRQQNNIEAPKPNSTISDVKKTRIESTDYSKWDKYDAGIMIDELILEINNLPKQFSRFFRC